MTSWFWSPESFESSWEYQPYVLILRKNLNAKKGLETASTIHMSMPTLMWRNKYVPQKVTLNYQILWHNLFNLKIHIREALAKNKLAKARKMRKPPGTFGLKKFGPGKIWVENVWTQNTCILGFLHTFILISGNPSKTQNIFYKFSHWIGWF